MAKVNVANYHTGPVVVVLKPGDDLVNQVELEPGVVTSVDESVWALMKNNSIIKHLLSVDKIEVVKAKQGDVPLNNTELVDLVIPPELTRPEEVGQMKGVSAKVMTKQVETKLETVNVETEAPKATSKRGRKKR